MVTTLASDQGRADCLAKFAIDANAFQRLEALYGHLPGEQFQKHVMDLAAQESKGGGKLSDPLGVLQSPTGAAVNPTVGGLDKTYVRPPVRDISFNREQIQQMPVGDLHKALTGRAPPSQAAAPLGSLNARPPSGPTAGTVGGRSNPLLQPPKLPR